MICKLRITNQQICITIPKLEKKHVAGMKHGFYFKMTAVFQISILFIVETVVLYMVNVSVGRKF
jgi:hypothetical protein